MTLVRPLIATLLALAVTGCASEEDTKPKYQPTLTWLMANVFNPSKPTANSCVYSNCHSSVDPSNGVDLTDPSKVIALKGKQAGQGFDGRSDWLIIDPGKPENSSMYRYLQGNAKGDGAQEDIMPPGGKLSAAQLAAVKEWILNGAKND